MRLLSVNENKDVFRFRFEPAHRDWFTQIVGMYPTLQESFRANNRRNKLIESALKDGREKLRERAASFLRGGTLEIDAEFNEYWDLTLRREEMEELLQILNNVRVGLWVQKGRPDPEEERAFIGPPTYESIRNQMIMHVCVALQGILMDALEPEVP